MLSALSNFTNAVYNVYNNTNTTELLEAAQNATKSLTERALKSSQFKQNDKTPSLEKETITVISDETEKFLTTTETGRQIATQTKLVSTEIAKIFQKNRLYFFQKINGTWQFAKNMYSDVSTEVIKKTEIVKEHIENVKNAITGGLVGRVRQYLNITPGDCYTPPQNPTLLETCVFPTLDCWKHTLGVDASCCIDLPEICEKIDTEQAINYSWDYIVNGMKKTSSTIANSFTSGAHKTAQWTLSTIFSVHPLTGHFSKPPMGNMTKTLSSWSLINLGAGLTHVYNNYKGNPNSRLQSLYTGAFIGSTATYLWGLNPLSGGVQGALAQTGIDTTLSLAGTFLPSQERLNRIINPNYWNWAPIASVATTLIALKTLEQEKYLNANDYISTSSTLYLLAGSGLYATSKWARNVIGNSWAPVAFLSLIPTYSYLSAAAPEFLGDCLTTAFPGSETLLYTTTAILGVLGAYAGARRALPAPH